MPNHLLKFTAGRLDFYKNFLSGDVLEKLERGKSTLAPSRFTVGTALPFRAAHCTVRSRHRVSRFWTMNNSWSETFLRAEALRPRRAFSTARRCSAAETHAKSR